jgi:hypothetical protein
MASQSDPKTLQPPLAVPTAPRLVRPVPAPTGNNAGHLAQATTPIAAGTSRGWRVSAVKLRPRQEGCPMLSGDTA